MNERIKIIQRGGFRVISVDLSNLNEDEILQMQTKMLELSLRERVKYFLINIKNTHTTEKIKNGSIEIVKKIEAELGKSETVLLGLTGIQKLIANLISKDIYFAKDEEDGMRWLSEKSKKSA
ncbi:MAG: hypothetical protein JW969_09020 [Spirochaetales bacterium]|nr:hypothetical protein [Spirochaetales bacterium]